MKMLWLWVAALLVLPATALAQASPDTFAASLRGRWVGVLEYRDYSQPADSTQRVQLPTWLDVTADGDASALAFTYDDGPNKTVTGSEHWLAKIADGALDVTDTTLTEHFTVVDASRFHEGHGVLVMKAVTTDNGKPAEMRRTLTLRRNLLSWTDETRPANSTAPFAFRHRYTFTRAVAPATAVP